MPVSRDNALNVLGSALALAAALGFAISPRCGWADTAHPDATAAQVTSPASAPMAAEQPFLAESRAAMDKMMAGMDVRPTGDVDADFAAMMIPHHQGAIDMVDVLFKSYGAAQGDDIYKFASDVYADQTTEIEVMKQMLAEIK